MAYTAGLHDLWRTCVAFEKWEGLSKPAATSVYSQSGFSLEVYIIVIIYLL